MQIRLTFFTIFWYFQNCYGSNIICIGQNCYLEYAEWVVEVQNSPLEAKYLADCLNARIISSLKFHSNSYLLRAKNKETNRVRRTMFCKRKPYVLWLEEQIPRKRTRRYAADIDWNDPLYPKMWYMTRSIAGKGYDMNILEAWKMNYTGNGVVLTIMDDGVDYTHKDLRRNYDPLASYDLIENDPDPMPNLNSTESNKHGTRCAGQIAAEGNNSVCVVGVAYNARIGGIRMLNLHITDTLESEALAFRNDYIHIYSGSWGPEDTGKMYEGPGVLAQSAFQQGIVSGRHGLGSIYVWAAGNGGVLDSCACDGYASSIFTLSVNSVGEHNSRPSYLEECSSTLATTYSSGGPSEKMIATIDPNQGCTTSHTGTSASAPMAAGIIALLLEANPRLSWRDVQYITLLTANPSPFVDGNFSVNAAGRAYSMLYGYGLMDAGKMVRLGELWRGLPAHHRCTSRIGNVSLRLEGRFNHTYELNFTGCFPVKRVDGQTYAAYALNASEEGHAVRYLEHVQLYADIFYQRRGVLQITLISPSGTETVLQPPRVYDDHPGNIGLLRWPLTTVQLWGESALGVWRIRLENIAEGKVPLSMRPDLTKLRGYWRAVWLVVYGTDEFPIRLRPPKTENPPPPEWFATFSKFVVNDSDWHKAYTCHAECAPGGCSGPAADQCLGGCLHFATEFRECVSTCPSGTTPYGALRITLPSQNTFWAPSHRTRINKPGRSHGANVVCQPCWTLCAACVRPHTEYDCTACANGQYLVPLIVPSQSSDELVHRVNQNWKLLDVALPEVAGICRSDCPPGFFVNKSTNTCAMCMENCAECTGPDSAHCSLCKPGYRLLMGRCVDGNSVDGRCELGKYLHQSQCVDCHPACEPYGCLSENGLCYHCKSDHPFLHHGICVQSCPPNWYPGLQLAHPFVTTITSLSGSTIALRLCEPCPPGCQMCRSSNQCVKCLPGLTLVGTMCINQSSVSDCPPQCMTCLHNGASCLSCIGHQLLVPSLQLEASFSDHAKTSLINFGDPSYFCSDHCPQGTYADHSESVCRLCPPSCTDCSDETHCFACRPPFILDPKTALCHLARSCRRSEFYDPGLKRCIPCDNSCATCVGSRPSDCTSCRIHGPMPRCLYGRNSLAKAESSDQVRGRCVPCCAYKMVLLNGAPKDCLFCVADRVTCLVGADINAGEGLVIVNGYPQTNHSSQSWLFEEPSRLILLILSIILLLAAITFVAIHLFRTYRQQRNTTNAIAVIRRRRRLKEHNHLNPYTDGAEDGVHQPLTAAASQPISDTIPLECLNKAKLHTRELHVPYTSVGRPNGHGDVRLTDNDDYDFTSSVPICTTHRSDEFCTRVVNRSSQLPQLEIQDSPHSCGLAHPSPFKTN